MAEARSEDDEENMRETREQVVRRQPNSSGGRPDRRKPEHRHSQGPLSSIRAAIKRTSNRSTSLSETPPRERERERERERDRDRRRPEITILSAEPLSSTSWFPGASVFPPPPPPAAQIWGPTIVPSLEEIQPPPSYEEVIREKTQEQVIVPASSPQPPSSLSQHHHHHQPFCKTTTATQTDTGSTQGSQDSPVQRPSRPPRPSFPSPSSKTSKIDDHTPSLSSLSSSDGGAVASNSTQTQNGDLLSDLTSSAAQTGQCDNSTLLAKTVSVQPRPRPRPRSKVGLQLISNEVKVQTLVKLREDGLATLAARARSGDQVNIQEENQGKYLQELLEAFSSDDWGFPEQRSGSQSESEDEQEQEVEKEEEDDDMATLRARIQAFEQMHDGSSGESVEPCVSTKPRPEPKPRPRLQQTTPPAVAPKPKNISNSDLKPSCKGFWEEDGGQNMAESETIQTAEELKTEPVTVKPIEKPTLTPKPQLNSDATNLTPIPAPRPSPPQPKLPPRPTVAPRTSLGPPQERGPTVGRTTPPMPPRPTTDIRTRAKTDPTNGQDTVNQSVKVGSSRPGVPSKPPSLACTRRASAPSLGSSGQSPDSSPVPSKSSPGPSRPSPVQSRPPAPVLRKYTSVQSSSDPPLPTRPTGVKLLPLRPPPIKSIPERPPPPGINSSSPTPSLNKTPSPVLASKTDQSTNQTQRASKRGPPLPPRPKPGHPLYNNTKQEVLIVLDDPSPARSEPNSQSGDRSSPAPVSALIDSSPCLLDLDSDLEPVQNQDQTKPALEGLTETQSILPVEPIEQKELPETTPISGPRCVALFDYEAVEEDELTFSQGDVISLLELIGGDWGRGQLHKRIGIFPLNFSQIIEPLPSVPSSPGETTKMTPAQTSEIEKSVPTSSTQDQPSEAEEWAVAVFDFSGQTEEDLSFQKGALIRVLEHINAEWRRGRVGDREGLYPAAFTQPNTAQPITVQRSEAKAKALFDFTAENEDELPLKVGDILTHVEFVNEQWIMGVVGSKRGIVPKNYISIL